MFRDASQLLWTGMPKLPALPEVAVCPVTAIAEGRPLNISRIDVATHAGTHVDAPRHIVADGTPIDEVPLDRLCGPGVVAPVTRRAGEAITVADVTAAGVDIHPGMVVLLSTGWGSRFTHESYLDHPHLSVELAEWLVDRQVSMVGIDCCTVDVAVGRRDPAFDYPVHRALLGNGIPIIENLADVGDVAGRPLQVFAFPLAVRGGDAGHARVVVEV